MTQKLTQQQIDAVVDDSAALQIVACAGAGKTEVLARRVARRLEQDVDPAGLVAFTFTNKAAGELKDRIERRSRELGAWTEVVPPTARGLYVGTIHAFCLERLRSLGGRYEGYDVLPTEREWALLLRYARRLGIIDAYAAHCQRSGDKVAASRAVGAFSETLEMLHAERVDRAALAAEAPRIHDLVERYEGLLHRMRLFSFGTAIETACRLLAPGGPLSDQLCGRVSHVFVDEYQDLNRAQETLVRRLRDLGAEVTVVGDDDQAIYQWRGGDVQLFIEFSPAFAASQHTLDVNHRSQAPITRLAAMLASGIADRLPKEMEAGRAGDGPSVELMAARDAGDEAELVAARIAALVEGGHAPGEIAILLRSVGTSGGAFRDALRKRGIACRAGGRTSLLDRPETALVTRVLVAWAGGTWWPDREERVTRERLTADLADLAGLARSQADRRIDKALRLGQEAAESGCFDLVGRFHELMRTLGLPSESPDPAALEASLGQLSSLLAEFEHAQRRAGPTAEELGPVASPDASDEEREDRTLSEAESNASPAPLAPGPSAGDIFLHRLTAFLETFSRQAVEARPDPGLGNADVVRLMTIHAAKGLEFPVVFVPALVDRRFPSSMTGRKKDWLLPDAIVAPVRARYEGRIEDELRLLYVALTRARDLLVLSFFGKRPSPFVHQLEPAIEAGLVAEAGTAHPEPQGSLDEDPDLLDTDFSALAVYAECGFKYRLRYVCGFAPPIAYELGFGHVLHHVLAELARAAAAGVTVSHGLADTILERDFYLPFAGQIKRKKLLESARARVHAFVDRGAALLARTIEPEFPFEVSLAGARVRGRIDLLARADNGDGRQVALIDFKTTSDRPAPEAHENQLRLYAEAARALGYEPVALEIHDLRVEGGATIVEDDDSQRSEFRKKLDGWVSGISTGTFEPCLNRRTCRACDFKRFCRHAR